MTQNHTRNKNVSKILFTEAMIEISYYLFHFHTVLYQAIFPE